LIRYSSLTREEKTMCRFILCHHFYEEGNLMLAMYDKKKQWFFTIPWWKYRMKIKWYNKQGVQKGDNYE
jgi:hypothetical protein